MDKDSRLDLRIVCSSRTRDEGVCVTTADLVALLDAADERDRLRDHFESCRDCYDCLGECDPKTAVEIGIVRTTLREGRS